MKEPEEYAELNRKLRQPTAVPASVWVARFSAALTFAAWIVGVFQITVWLVPERFFASLGYVAVAPLLLVFWFCGKRYFDRKIDP